MVMLVFMKKEVNQVLIILNTMIFLLCLFNFFKTITSKNSSRVPIPPGDIMNASEFFKNRLFLSSIDSV